MTYYDARVIKKLAEDAEEFIVFFQGWIDSVEIEPALNVLKISALYYNRFSEQSEDDYTCYFGQCIYLLLVRFPSHCDEILKMEKDCRTIHVAYNDFFRRIRVMNERFYRKEEYKLNAFLMFSEISLSVMLSLLSDIPNSRLESIFPIVFRMHGLPLSEDVTPHNVKSISMIFDQVCSYTGNIFKELRHSNVLELEHHCSEETVKNAGGWIKEWDDYDSLNRISDLFRFCNAKVNYLDLNNISIEVNEDCTYKDYEVARSRFTMRGTGVYYEIQKALEENPNFIEQLKLIVPEWINESDFFPIAYFSEMENMSPEDLYIEYGGVNIYAWIHAYGMLVAIAKQEMDERFHRTTPGNLQLKDWVIYHTRDEWIRLFVEGGLCWVTAALVTDYFTFDDKALDINDCPLLQCNDGLCMLPSIVSMSCVTRSLLSLFSAKNISIDDKGKIHEREFIQRVRNSKICAAQLSVRKDYDCDCAMIIQDHLFFVELKSNGHPVHFNRYYQTLVNINGCNVGLKTKTSWIKQVTRYANYYSTQLELVRDALGLPAGWEPKGFHKMIVTTSVFGGIYHQEGCFIVDKTAFYSFIERIVSVTTEVKNGMRTQIIPESDRFYHGEITIEKMLGFLDELPSITAKRRRVKLLEYNVQCGEINFTYPFFDIWPAFETVLKEDGTEAVAIL